MEKKFEVGQAWKMRNGDTARITDIADNGAFPVEAHMQGRGTISLTLDGNYRADGTASEFDLMEPAEDGPKLKAYSEHIKPLLDKAMEYAKEHGISIATVAILDQDEVGEMRAASLQGSFNKVDMLALKMLRIDVELA